MKSCGCCFVLFPKCFLLQMGLIPAIDSVQNLCSQTDIESFRRFQCVGLAAEADPNESLPDVCESLIKSMSARINKGAVRKFVATTKWFVTLYTVTPHVSVCMTFIENSTFCVT